VDGYQLGQDFVHLHQILQESAIYNSTGLYGPDIGQPRDHRKDLLNGFVFRKKELKYIFRVASYLIDLGIK